MYSLQRLMAHAATHPRCVRALAFACLLGGSNAALAQDGEAFIDGDGDGLSDVVEAVLESDPERRDTNRDGVEDGLAVLVGASPLTGAAPTDAVPKFAFPHEGARLPSALAGAWPQRIQLKPVPGATGYVIQLIDAEGQVRVRQIRRLEDGGAVQAEWVWTALSMPGGLSTGDYTIDAQGFYGHPRHLVGGRAVHPVRVDAVEADEVVLRGERVLSGVILARHITVERGAVVRVPAGESLTLIALTDLEIEPGAAIIGEDGANGAHIGLSAERSVRVDGVVLAGRGADAVDRALEGPADQDARVHGALGGRGGDVWMFTNGALNIGEEGRVHAGDGGHGGGAFARAADARADFIFEAVQDTCMQPAPEALERCALGCEGAEEVEACRAQCEEACLTGRFDVDGQRAVAIGGRGGAGGDLITWGPEMAVPQVPGVLRTGLGGQGGAAEAQGGRAGVHGRAGAASGVGGPGGASGDLMLHQHDFNRDGRIDAGTPEDPIGGGDAGAPGAVAVLSGDAAEAEPIAAFACACPKWGRDGQDPLAVTGVAGGRGWLEPGDGAPASAQGGRGSGCGRGGDAVATGGQGGDLRALAKPISLGFVEFNWAVAAPTIAGFGGMALARGGAGGRYGVGQGGNASALGGAGGHAPMAVGGASHLSVGGDGGPAIATGGAGRTGYTCCVPSGQGGNGGQSGQAKATGGVGGDAFNASGDGGYASANSYNGGRGGDGVPVGRGGDVGSTLSVGGEPGKSVTGIGAGVRGKLGKKRARTKGPNGRLCLEAG